MRHQSSPHAVMPLLRDTAPRVRFFAAEALGRMAHRAAAPALVEMLAENDDRTGASVGARWVPHDGE